MNKHLKASMRTLLPHTIRPRRILSGPLRTHWIVTSWHDYPAAIAGYTERALLGWLAGHVEPGETWLDIGAHYGYIALALCRLVGASGRVFSFEPMLTTAGHIAHTRLLNNLHQLSVLPLALGAPQAAMLRQHLPTTRGMVDSTLSNGNGEWQESILVTRLDWLWPHICGEHHRIDGIKIDVQGMEVAVLHGMTELLQRWHPRLVVEFHQGVERHEVLQVLAAAGYTHPGIPIEPVAGEQAPRYLDNSSYAFLPDRAR